MLVKKHVLFVVVATSLPQLATSASFDWAVRIGGSSGDSGSGITSDGAGGSLFAGQFEGTTTFGSTTLTSAGSDDIFVAHMTSTGSIDWAVQAGGANEDKARAISSDGNGGAFVAGYFMYTASFGSTTLTSSYSGGFVMHVTSAGVIDWAVQADGQCRSIAFDGSGGALVTGYFYETGSFGSTTLSRSGNTADTFVMHVTSAGVIDWALQVGGASKNYGYAIASDGAAGALVTGSFASSVSFGGTTLDTGSTSESDPYVAHVTSTGFSWAVQVDGAYSGNGISSDGAGGAFAVGENIDSGSTASFGAITLTNSGSNSAGYVMHVTGTGTVDWVYLFEGTQEQFGNGVASDGAGGALVTGIFREGTASFGSTTLTGVGNRDAFVMRVTSAGIDWAVQASSTSSSDSVYGIDVASDGVVTGFFTGSASFGSTTLTSAGGYEVFVSRLLLPSPPLPSPPSPPPPSPSPPPPSPPPPSPSPPSPSLPPLPSPLSPHPPSPPSPISPSSPPLPPPSSPTSPPPSSPPSPPPSPGAAAPSPSPLPPAPSPPPPFPSPPTEVETTVETSFTLSGDPSDYGTEEEDAIKTVLAEEAGVNISAVTLTITAGSVVITAEIVLPSSDDAATATTALSTGVLASADALETALVTQFAESSTSTTCPSPASSPPRSSSPRATPMASVWAYSSESSLAELLAPAFSPSW